jgi:hypothetical protein
MPLTGVEVSPSYEHPLARWMRIHPSGVVIRLSDQPKTVYRDKKEPVTCAGYAEMLDGTTSMFTWRLDQAEVLGWWTKLAPRWLLLRLYPIPRPKLASSVEVSS